MPNNGSKDPRWLDLAQDGSPERPQDSLKEALTDPMMALLGPKFPKLVPRCRKYGTCNHPHAFFTTHAHTMHHAMLCPCYAHAMPMLCPCYAHALHLCPRASMQFLCPSLYPCLCKAHAHATPHAQFQEVQALDSNVPKTATMEWHWNRAEH